MTTPLTLADLDALVDAMTPGKCSVLHTNQPIIRGEHHQNLLMVEDCNQADENALGFAALKNLYPALVARLRRAEEVLREGEWVSDFMGRKYCFHCSGDKPDHFPDCKVGAFLAESNKPLNCVRDATKGGDVQ